jgi:THO complex subunit 3
VRFSTELKGHLAPIEKVAFSPTRECELASMSSDGVVKFWDARSKTCFNEIKNLGESIALSWAPDGETLVVGNKVRDPPIDLQWRTEYWLTGLLLS